MLVVRYSKRNGAEFISHLDTLRHIQKTVLRAGISVAYSKGFNPHMLIFMSSPIAAGLISFAEYFFIESDIGEDEFKEKFNLNCPKGMRCESVKKVDKNPNLAAIIDGARYVIKNVPDVVDLNMILNAKEFFVTDKKGKRVDVRDKIKEIYRQSGDVVCYLASGNSPLRVDLLINELNDIYKTEIDEVIKTDSFIGWQEVEKCI